MRLLLIVLKGFTGSKVVVIVVTNLKLSVLLENSICTLRSSRSWYEPKLKGRAVLRFIKYIDIFARKSTINVSERYLVFILVESLSLVEMGTSTLV